MTTPNEVVARLGEISVAEIEPDALGSADVYRAASLIPLFAFAARDAELRGLASADPGVASIIDAGRSAVVAGVWENQEIVPRMLSAFEGFSFSENSGWIEALPMMRTGLEFDLGVSDEKRQQFWIAIDETFAGSRASLFDPDALQAILAVDIFGIGGVGAEWAVLSPFNWTQFAGETATIVGGLTVAAAGISTNAVLLLPAGVLLICGASLKQLAG